MVVTDKNGKIKRRTRWRKSRSLTIGFLKHLQFITIHALNGVSDVVAIVDTGGVSRNFSEIGLEDIRKFAMAGPDNVSTYGIVVGTGSNAVANSDYSLQTQIAHGTGSTQLDYGATSYTAAQIVGVNVDLILSRALYNGSGATITVTEMGIYVASYDTGTVARYICVCRDLIAAVQVLDTETASAQYTFRTTA
jgi:hypothetical protein